VRLVAYSFLYNIFLGIAVSCILSMWPSHRIRWLLINLTIFSPLILLIHHFVEFSIIRFLSLVHIFFAEFSFHIYIYIQGVSKPMSQTFPGYSPLQLKQKIPINMGPKVNRFRDIHCCVEIREMLWLTFQPHSTPIPEWPFPWEVDRA
jgi:hypothetical protein